MSALLSLFLDLTVSLPKVSFTKIRRYTLSDALNTIPELVIEVLSPEPDLDMADLVGQTAVAFLGEPAVPRFDGIVRSVEQRTMDSTGVSCYALTIVPRLWLTTQRSGHRIFQQKTALEIAAAVLAGHGPAMDSLEGWLFHGALEAHDYRVQCGESDDDFVFRILAEEGLCAGFVPDPGGRLVWVVTDDTSAGGAEMDVPFRPASGALAKAGPHVSAVTVNARVCASAVKVRDFNHENPAFRLDRGCAAGNGAFAEDVLERYSYAVGRFDDEQGGDRLAAMRLQTERAKRRTYRWEASFAMRPGMKLRLHDHPRDDANGEFLVVSAWSEVEASGRKHFAEVVPAAVPWRPALRPKPRIHGTQTAFVVGAPGLEIDADKDGRVAVKFHWDTRKDGASRRVRVTTPWAGPSRGFWALPRVGDEVVIAYLDGDPDEPMVVGSVHNAIAPPALPLPESETRSAWMSRSTPGGNGYNYIVMEDAAGKEFLALRAERDFECYVGRSASTKIGGDQVHQVTRGQSTKVGGDVATDIDGRYHLNAGQIDMESGADFNVHALGSRQDSSGGDHAFNSPVITLTATSRIKLEVGGSSLTMEDGKITLTAALIELNP